MAFFALVLSLWIFGSGDMLVFRVAGEVSQIIQIAQDDIVWRYLAAFGYAAVALTVIASLAVFYPFRRKLNRAHHHYHMHCTRIYHCIQYEHTCDRHTCKAIFVYKLFGGMERLLYIATTQDGIPIKGSIEDIQSIQRSLMILVGHIGLLLLLSIYIFKRKDILS